MIRLIISTVWIMIRLINSIVWSKLRLLIFVILFTDTKDQQDQ